MHVRGAQGEGTQRLLCDSATHTHTCLQVIARPPALVVPLPLVAHVTPPAPSQLRSELLGPLPSPDLVAPGMRPPGTLLAHGPWHLRTRVRLTLSRPAPGDRKSVV